MIKAAIFYLRKTYARSSMMSYVVCCFLQLTWFEGLASKIILANQGESVHLFEKTDYMFQEVSLYIHENRNPKLIVSWTYKDGFFSVGWKDKTYSKIFMTPHGNIWIAAVDGSYQKQYSINNSPSPEVELIILEKQSVREGDLVHLFKNVDEPDKEVSLWISEDINYIHIVTWRIDNVNKNITLAWMTNKYRKIKMDENRDVWIDNVDVNYNGKYFIPNSSRPGVDLMILGSSQLKSDSEMTTFIGVIIVLVAILFIFVIIQIIKCLRNRRRRSYRMNHDIPPTGTLLPRSSPNSAENIVIEEHGLQQRSNDIPPTESLFSRSLPNSSEINMRETRRRLRRTIKIIPPSGTLPPRSSADSAENVISETKRRLRQMGHVMSPTGSLLPRSLPYSAEGEEKGKGSDHEEKSQNPAINLSQEVKKKADGNILDIRKTKFVKRRSMGRTVDLHSSKFDTQGKGSEASTKLEHHERMLRPRKSGKTDE